MESLYVCHFSNGHIKVGRSINPTARIAAHADRVACLGVLLVEHFITAECVDNPAGREFALIEQCAQIATARHFDEWFVGVDYEAACVFAQQAASGVGKPQAESVTVWSGMLRDLRARGHRQTAIALHCGCCQPVISDLATGRIRDPAYSIGAKLVALHAKHCIAPTPTAANDSAEPAKAVN